MFRIRRTRKTILLTLLLTCLSVWLLLRGLLAREGFNGSVQDSRMLYRHTGRNGADSLGDYEDDNGVFMYRYQGDYADATSGKPMRISSNLTQRFGWHKLQFAEMTRDLAQGFVIVSAGSSGFVRPLESIVGSIQRFLPRKTVIIYDLGMNDAQVNKVRSWCQVEYRKFDFSVYPAHVKRLTYYAWKPLVIMEVLRDHPGVLWLDSSAELHNSDFGPVFEILQKTDGAVCFSSTGHSTFAVTHPEMYEYLPTNFTAAKREEQWEANSMLLYRTKSVFERVIKWWVLCALEKSCMATDYNPSRACLFSADRYNTFTGCHRFDQSALNILLLNHFNFDRWAYYSRYRVLKIRRHGSVYNANVCSELDN